MKLKSLLLCALVALSITIEALEPVTTIGAWTAIKAAGAACFATKSAAAATIGAGVILVAGGVGLKCLWDRATKSLPEVQQQTIRAIDYHQLQKELNISTKKLADLVKERQEALQKVQDLELYIANLEKMMASFVEIHEKHGTDVSSLSETERALCEQMVILHASANEECAVSLINNYFKQYWDAAFSVLPKEKQEIIQSVNTRILREKLNTVNVTHQALHQIYPLYSYGFEKIIAFSMYQTCKDFVALYTQHGLNIEALSKDDLEVYNKIAILRTLYPPERARAQA